MSSKEEFFGKLAQAVIDGEPEDAEELAKQAGCTRQTIIALEQGRYVPSITLAFQIARAFGVLLEEVFQYEETSR